MSAFVHFCLFLYFNFSEMKRQMKAEKKAADKEAKIKESGDTGAQDGEEETLDPNV